MLFIFHIDKFFITYSYNDDMLSLWCQTRLKKYIKNGTQGKFYTENSNILFTFNTDKFFINYSCNDDMLSL